ncbi:smoothelin 1 isoform X6 [Brachionus plicatilis]|uniref:Smoothelin 1 isoform X6 n=1 Tax=Brachionus plicatilis TaxID=10195 RepID=A0A3M7QUL8_BRAPC|nr:smoothelin 1 isoform X6 [Brachionus plicatilis]
MKCETNKSVSALRATSLKIHLDPTGAQVAQKNPPCSLTNEETLSLAGVVAKTRALFESNLNSHNFSTPQTIKNKKAFKPFSSIQVAREKSSISIPVQSELDKENSIQSVDQTPTKSILRDNYPRQAKIEAITLKKSFSANRISSCLGEEARTRGRLNSANVFINKSEEISKELNIPMSVKQAKACFESLVHTSPNFATPKSSNGSFRVRSAHLAREKNIPLSAPTGSNCKIDTNKSKFVMPDILNSLTSSSSSTGSESSVFNNSSSSSCENTPRLADNKKSVYKTTKVAERIKKLEESKCLDAGEPNSRPILLPSLSVSSQWTCQNSGHSSSSKFVQLYKKQMEVSCTSYRKLEDIINEADQSIAQSVPIEEEKQEKKLKSILRKAPKSEPLMMSEIKIETKSSVRSPSCSSSSPSCSPSSSFSSLTAKPAEQKIELSQQSIDNSSCVLPSKMRQRTQSLDMANSQECSLSLNVSKMNSSFTSGVIKTPSKSVGSYIKNVSYSSGNTNSGLVKSLKPHRQKSGDLITILSILLMCSSTFISKLMLCLQKISRESKVTRSATNAREALIRWCRKMTEEYDNVSISNFSSSWSDGLAFCALLHHFMPNEFDFATLKSNNRRFNFDLAFKTAESKAGIVPLLDVDDMIEMGDSPDWKCVFTYVHSIEIASELIKKQKRVIPIMDTCKDHVACCDILNFIKSCLKIVKFFS